MSSEIISLKPFKHAPSVEVSTWYQGILSTQLATADDTGGAFDLVLSNMTEPPPHIRIDRGFVGFLRLHHLCVLCAGQLGKCL
jgi:hypothetical protein